MKMADKCGTKPKFISDSGIFRSVEVPSRPLQNRNVNA